MTTPSQSSAEEWRWAIGWSLAILLLSCIPYMVAVIAAPEEWQFAGFLVNPLDGHSYLAKMQQGLAGRWLFHLTYSPEPHEGAFIFTLYLALGHLSRATGLPMIIIFHLARLLAGFGLLLMAYRFIGRITPHPAERRLAFILTFTASGLGWLGASFGAFPIDLWVPEAFVPYSLYANPHFPLAMMFMLIIFDQILSSLSQTPNFSQTKTQSPKLKTQNLKPVFWAGLSALALAIILPFALLTVWAILGVFLSWLIGNRRSLPWPQIWPTLGVVIFSAPMISYQYWVSITNPVLAGWGAQNITTAPKFLDFWLGYGLVGMLALVGTILIVRDAGSPTKEHGRYSRSRDGEWLVVLWAVTTVVLVYIPFDLQRRLITGMHLPLCILAAIGLSRWLVNSRLKFGYQRLLTVGVVTIGALGTVFVWVLPLVGTFQPPTESATSALFFMRQEEIAAFAWLAQNTAPDDVVLASPRVGLFVPGQTGARAFYGHPFETVEAKIKEAQAEAFYRGEVEAVTPWANYIIYGPSEQALGGLEILSDLPVVYSAGDLLVYKVAK